jgi:hypothetical protein
MVPHVCEREHPGLDDNRRPFPDMLADSGLEEPPEEGLFLECSDCEPEGVQEQRPAQRGSLCDRSILRRSDR